MDRPHTGPGQQVLNNYVHELLADDSYAFRSYQDCREFCKNKEYMPLNVGDYIRWEGSIDRRLGEPKYEASKRFLAARPEE